MPRSRSRRRSRMRRRSRSRPRSRPRFWMDAWTSMTRPRLYSILHKTALLYSTIKTEAAPVTTATSSSSATDTSSSPAAPELDLLLAAAASSISTRRLQRRNFGIADDGVRVRGSAGAAKAASSAARIRAAAEKRRPFVPHKWKADGPFIPGPNDDWKFP